MYYCFRLKKGMDLKKELTDFAVKNNISGVILSCVGCVTKFNVRLAGARECLEKEGEFEIVSVTGTLSVDGVHIHIAFSDTEGNTFGGHLKDGCIIDCTAEVCIVDIEDYQFNREFDESTGYKELVVIEK